MEELEVFDGLRILELLRVVELLEKVKIVPEQETFEVLVPIGRHEHQNM